MGHKHKKEKKKHRSRSISRSPERDRDRERERYVERDRDRERERDRERDRDRDRERDRERTKHRHHHKKHHKERKEKKVKDENYDSTDSDCILVPPPPKISRPATPPPPAISTGSTGSSESLSIEEANRIRAKLGLKPLQVDEKTTPEVKGEGQYKNSTEQTAAEAGLNVINDDLGEFVHKPADNLARKTQAEKLKTKLAERKEKRQLEAKLSKVKTLGESDSEEDDVNSWVKKNRVIAKEKEKAEKRAKMLEELDAEFGVGELVEDDMRAHRSSAYTAKDLRGLKVEHQMDNLVEGKATILTLKDQNVLAEGDDVLVNVNLLDDERYKKNIERKKQKPGYNAFDEDDLDEFGQPKNKILGKYDEEIEGEKKDGFVIGTSESMAAAHAAQQRQLMSVKNKLAKKRLETLALPAPQLASEYLSAEEISAKFKKPKKVRKIRKGSKMLKAADLAAELPVDDGLKDLGTRRRAPPPPPPPPKIKNEDSEDSNPPNVKEEPMDIDSDLDIDDLPPPPDLSNVKVEDDSELEFQLALIKARKLKEKDSDASTSVEKVAKMILSEASLNADTEAGGSIVLNATAEFCRTLGDIPTYGLSGNRDEDAEEMMDFEREMMQEKIRLEEDSRARGAWNEVEIDDTHADVLPAEAPILEPEPDLGAGVAGALRLAVSKGYLEKETGKRPSASRFAHLQAQNYSIEDKAYGEDEKFGRRERYMGPSSEFKEKDGYKPNVKLDYIDDEGHVLNAKEAFRYMSHKFHGKGPGKNKVEKRMKKMEQDALMKQMSSTDTPLGTLNMLQAKQKETQSPFIVLSGGKHQTTAISKTKLSKL